MNGPGAQTWTLGANDEVSLGDLTFNNSNGVSLLGPNTKIRSIGAINLESGTVTTNDYLVVGSNSSGTGYLDDFSAGFTGSLVGDLIVERYLPGPGTSGTSSFHHWSPPVVVNNVVTELVELNLGSAGVNGSYIIPQPTCNPNVAASNSPYAKGFQWDETHAGFNFSGCDQDGWFCKTTGSLIPGEGFIFIGNTGDVIDAQGVMNTGNMTLTATQVPTLGNSGAVGDGWNLFANPYASAWEWNSPSGYDGQAAVWNATGFLAGSFQSFLSGVGVIASGQTFFARISSVGTQPTMSFNQADRVAAAGTFYRTAPWYTDLLTLYVEGNGFADRTQVYFDTNPTNNWDSQYDAMKLESRGGQPTLFTSIAGYHDIISINGLPLTGAVSTVPLGLMPGTDGSFTIRAEDLGTFEATAMIFLEDLKLGVIHNLRANPQYTFNMNVMEDVNRFVLHFVPEANITAQTVNCEGLNGAINIDFGQYAVAGNTLLLDSYSIVDDNGTVVSSGTNVNGAISATSLAQGTYTLTIDVLGYQASETITVNALAAVLAAFAPNSQSVEVGETVSFSNVSTGATNYDWNFGDGTTASGVANPAHVYAQPGIYTVTLTAANNDCSDAIAIDVEVTQKTTGISNVATEELMHIFATENVVGIKTSMKEDFEISVMNVLGQEVAHAISSGHELTEVEVKNVADGYYMVKVFTEEDTYSAKVFISNK